MKPPLTDGTRVKVYLDKKFFGEPLYLGRGEVAGRFVFGPGEHEVDYGVNMLGTHQKVFIGTTSLQEGKRNFCIRLVVKKKKGGKDGGVKRKTGNLHRKTKKRKARD